MIVLALIALALCGFAVAATIWGVVLPRTQAVARMREIGVYGFPVEALAGQSDRRRSPILAIANRLGDLLPSGRYEAWIRSQLIAGAMYSISARTLIGLQFLGAAVFAGLSATVGIADTLPKAIGFSAVAGGMAWALPLAAVHGRARRRLDQIDRQTPDLIDMLVVTLEAGLGFGASLDAASQRMPAPIGDEIRLMMQEHKMGLSLSEAMLNTLERVKTPNMQSFIRSVTQGSELGVSMGTVMRNLAVEMRVRRRQRAEEQAHKAPVKMLFPLIFFMFPALGIVILGPALFEITDKLGNQVVK
jgi:tight adherence protein C